MAKRRAKMSDEKEPKPEATKEESEQAAARERFEYKEGDLQIIKVGEPKPPADKEKEEDH
jgi:hypothetical protein